MDEVKEIEVQQNAEEVKTGENKRTDPNSYKLMRDMLKEMKEYEKMMEEQTLSVLDGTYNLSSASIMGITVIPNSKIDQMSLEEINSFFKKYAKNKDVPSYYEDIEEAHESMHEVKKLQLNLLDMTEETKKIEEESNEILNDYAEFLSSEEVIKARQQRLENMKSLAEKETDEEKKRSILRMIKSMELTQSLDFIFERLNVFGKKEEDGVIDAFFNEKRGSYIIVKFKKKIGKFGFNVDLYKYFFNLEENFLDEKYHVFNNLFLFYYMRYVAHSDPYNSTDKLFVQSLTSAIANLVYHKFPSTATEKHFVHVLEKFETFFEDKRDYFYENNTTRPGHPIREEAVRKHEEERKTTLIAKMNELNIEGYDPNSTADELQNFFNEKMESLIAAEKAERETNKISEVKENEDGSVEITPVVESNTDEKTSDTDTGNDAEDN